MKKNPALLFIIVVFAFFGMLSAEAEGTRETYDSIRFDIEDKTYSDILSADGGAIWAKNSGTTSAPSTIKKSTFTNNATTGIGGAISAIISKIIISDTQFKDNRAANMGGGAIYACDSELTLEGTTFGGTGASDINQAKYGGAVYTIGVSDTQTSSTTVKNSSFINNKASESGGAFFAKKNSLTISNATDFNGNTATENGGAIFAEDSTVNIKNATAYELANEFEGNTAHRNGGALYLNLATAEIAGETTFKDNSGNIGGAIYANNTNLTLSSSNGRKPFFSGNEATLSGGAIYFASDNSNNLKVLAANFTDNEAVELGGAIYNKGGLIVVEDSYFYGNKATRQRAATFEGGKGGAINITNSNNDSNKITNSKFGMDSNPGNEAENGGAIWASASKLTIEDSIFKGNKATEDGGAIYAQIGSTITIKDTDFTENKATYGAAIFSQAGIVDILAENKDVLFENNNQTGSAGGTGTGIFINSGTLNLIANENRTINIQDKVIVAGSLSHNGILNINKDATGNPTTGTVLFNNGIDLSYATTTLYGGTLELGKKAATSTIREFVIGGNSTLDLQNSNDADVLTVGELSGNSTLNLNVDYNGATNKMDKITVGASSGTPNINLNLINIVEEGTVGTTQTVTYLDGGLSNATVEDKTIKVATSKKNLYTFTQDNVLENKGILTVEISSATNSLPDYIQDESLGVDKFNITDTGYRVFIDDAPGKNTLGILAGTGRTFTISGGKGNEFDRTINGILADNTRGGGVSIASGQTLILENISDFMNFKNAITSNGGTIDINNVRFTNDEADTCGGAINATGGTLKVENSTFSGNTATNGDGGAFFATVDDTVYPAIRTKTTITGSKFTNNKATNNGGAIYEKGGTLTVENSTFGGTETNGSNSAKNGGAIYVEGENTTTIKNSTFTSNTTTNNTSEEYNYGGAIYAKNSNFTISEGTTTFTDNKATGSYGKGGAIYTYEGSLKILDPTTFIGNTATFLGGAICIDDGGTFTVKNSTFKRNSSNDSGGAIYTYGDSTTIENSIFENNTAVKEGGAIYTTGGATTEIKNSEFTNNKATGANGKGGSIFSTIGSKTITNSTFTNNMATESGGAIFVELGSDVTITDSNFIGNKASKGAAIYSDSSSAGHSVVSIVADTKDVIFKNNNSTGVAGGTGTGIEVVRGGTLNIQASKNRTIDIQDEVQVEGTLKINYDATGTLTTGMVLFNNKLNLASATTTLYGGTLKLGENAENNLSLGALVFSGGGLDLRNGVVNTLNPSSINFVADTNLYLDVDLANQQMDRFDNTTSVTGSGNINVAGLQIISDRAGTTTVDFANNTTYKDNVSYTGDAEVEAMSHLYRYKVSYLNDSGQFRFARVQSKNPYNSFNPAVYGSTSAMQGVFLSQLANYDIALGNIDQNMLLNQSQKFALKYGNKYAANGETNPQVYSPLFIPDENKGIWLRPYASVEDVKLDNGPKVENQMYGALVGGDTDLFSCDNGWDAQYSAYVGYNGSHQAYSGNGIWQNGGMLGITGAFFKDNFFEALTANVGASHAEIKNNYLGNNDLGILSTGIASKTGYNWEFEDGMFIIQPSLTMSYSFVAPLNDYTLKNGVRIKNSNLNTIQLAPGLKFIGNLKYGWQPYLNFRMVWNILDDSKVKAAEVSLPETSVKPYFEYGLGVQKSIGERFSGFAQAMFRAGGRIGAAFSLGFRWALGDLNDKYQSNNDSSNIKKSSKTLKLRTLAKN